MLLTIHTDGGARSNPGPAAIGIVVTDEQNNEIYTHAEFLGIATNNEAEYKAILHALSWLKNKATPFAPSAVMCKLDSKLVVEQLNKVWKIKEDRLRVYALECWQLIEAIPYPINFTHIRREHNKIADALVNQALDAHMS